MPHGGIPIGPDGQMMAGHHSHGQHHGQHHGSTVTCCKTYYRPGGPDLSGASAYPHNALAMSNEVQESQVSQIGPDGKPLEPGTTCFQEPIYPPLPPNPFLLAKQLKLQKLLYPFLFKKRLFFG